MTLIIWKGNTICADKCVTTGDVGRVANKLVRVGNSVVAYTGPADFGMSMLAWARNGYIPAEFPSTQRDSDYAILVVAGPSGLGGAVSLFYQTPDNVPQASFGAVGVGAEFAIGAMAAGLSAPEAMELALQHIPRLGSVFGFDSKLFY